MEERPVPQSTVPGEQTVADAAVPAAAAAAGAQLDQEVGAADEHLARAHRVLPGAVGEVRPAGLGAVHALEDGSGRRRVSRRDRRRQLGRRDLQQEAGPRDHQRDERGAVGPSREERGRADRRRSAWRWRRRPRWTRRRTGGGRRARRAAASRSARSRPEGGRFWDPKTQYSCAPTPWGELIAVNANTGDIAWRVPLGSFDELEEKGIKAGRPSLGGAHHHRGRSGVHRRDDRRLLPRLRRQERRRVVVDQARPCLDIRFHRPTWARTASSTSPSRWAAADFCAARSVTKW